MPAALAAAALYGAPPLIGVALSRVISPARRPDLGRVDLLVPVGLLLQLLARRQEVFLQVGYVVLGVWLVIRLLRASGASERLAFALLGLGGLLNGVAILANGRMPHAAAGHETSLKGVPIDADTRLPWLGDVIPFLGKLISAGDLLLLAGAALLIGVALAATSTREADARPTADALHTSRLTLRLRGR
jgi:hypothetical protein